MNATKDDIVKYCILGTTIAILIVSVSSLYLATQSESADKDMIAQLSEYGGTIGFKESVHSSNSVLTIRITMDSVITDTGNYILVENSGYCYSIANGSTVWIPKESILYVQIDKPNN